MCSPVCLSGEGEGEGHGGEFVVESGPVGGRETAENQRGSRVAVYVIQSAGEAVSGCDDVFVISSSHGG